MVCAIISKLLQREYAVSDLKWKSDNELVDLIQRNQVYVVKMEADKKKLLRDINDIEASINGVKQRSDWALKYLSREEQPAYLKTRHEPMRSN